VARLRDKPAAESAADGDRARKGSSAQRSKTADAAARTRPAKATKLAQPTKPAEAEPPPEPPPEPRWMQALAPSERRRAKRLIDGLTAAGAPDPEGIARRDIVGEVPAAAAFAIAQAIKALGDDASPADVARLLADGRDEDLGIRWHLVDSDDRPIIVDLDAFERR
jgi:hypothetical protein